MNVRTKGFCSALLRCGEIKLIAEKREYAISDLIEFEFESFTIL